MLMLLAIEEHKSMWALGLDDIWFFNLFSGCCEDNISENLS